MNVAYATWGHVWVNGISGHHSVRAHKHVVWEMRNDDGFVLGVGNVPVWQLNPVHAIHNCVRKDNGRDLQSGRHLQRVRVHVAMVIRNVVAHVLVDLIVPD